MQIMHELIVNLQIVGPLKPHRVYRIINSDDVLLFLTHRFIFETQVFAAFYFVVSQAHYFQNLGIGVDVAVDFFFQRVFQLVEIFGLVCHSLLDNQDERVVVPEAQGELLLAQVLGDENLLPILHVHHEQLL